jgi:protein gp37
MASLLKGRLRFAANSPHIWWGVSIENKQHGLPRLRDLQESPASVRFLSVEPLLEELGRLRLRGVHWVIVGGESGPGARPLKKEWVTSIRDQCTDAGIPFFFKQWGGVRKKYAGRKLDGRTYDGFPVRQNNPVSPTATALAWAREIRKRYDLSQPELLPVLA